MFTNDKRVTEYRKQRQHVRSLVDLFYKAQRMRIDSSNKDRACEQGYDVDAVVFTESGLLRDTDLMKKISGTMESMEDVIAAEMTYFANQSELGRWCMSINGISGVLAAGLLGYVDFYRCCCHQYRHLTGRKRESIPVHDCIGLPTYGAILRFAGLVDKKYMPEWKSGQRRPWNASFKKHLWLIGDQFRRQAPSKVSLHSTEEEIIEHLRKDPKGKYKNCSYSELLAKAKKKKQRAEKKKDELANPSRLYAKLYLEEKARVIKRNDNGGYRELVTEKLAVAKKRGIKLPVAMARAWREGRLTKGQMDTNSFMWATQIFVSHFFTVGRKIYFGNEVIPYPMAHMGHTHYIAPPNWPMPEKKERKKKLVLTGK